MNPSDLQIFYAPKDRLRLTVIDRSYLSVKPTWIAPLSSPTRYLSLVESKGSEIALISDLEGIPETSLIALKQEIHRRYLAARVNEVTSVRSEFGVSYWSVNTDRGPRDFVTQSLQENAQWLTDTHLILLDVDGNRFEIPDVSALDRASRARVLQEV